MQCKSGKKVFKFVFQFLYFVRYGYIGDVTKTSERTMLLSILQALGFVMMPVADFCGGQIYKAGKCIKIKLS